MEIAQIVGVPCMWVSWIQSQSPGNTIHPTPGNCWKWPLSYTRYEPHQKTKTKPKSQNYKNFYKTDYLYNFIVWKDYLAVVNKYLRDKKTDNLDYTKILKPMIIKRNIQRLKVKRDHLWYRYERMCLKYTKYFYKLIIKA